MSRRSLLLALSCTAVALTAPGAHAGTLAADPAGGYVFTSGASEKLDLSLQGVDDGSTITFYVGSMAPIVGELPPGCVLEDFSVPAATCPLPARVRVVGSDLDDWVAVSLSLPTTVAVTMEGGAGNDRLDGWEGTETLYGGPGDDRLSGYKGNDVLDGGDGNDTLSGYSGADVVSGGAGDDVLHPDDYEDPSADVVDGGPGVDTIDADYGSRYADSSAPQPPLAFTLGGGADDGRPGEGDDVRNVERLVLSSGGTVTGSEGPDYVKLHQVGMDSVLLGAGGDDELRSGDGADRVEGGPGNDKLDAGYGDDVIVGGPGKDAISADLAGGDCGPLWCKFPFGNDVVEARDGEVDSIACGAGTDRVVADAVDVVAPDCETVERGAAPAAPAGPGVGPNPAPGPGVVPATVAITPRGLKAALRQGLPVVLKGFAPGKVQVKALRAGKPVASGTAVIGASGKVTVVLRFTKAAKASLAKQKRVALTIAAGKLRKAVTLRER
jgi:hypothetical protein